MTSLFKITSIVFLFFLLLHRGKKALCLLVIGILLFLSINLVSYFDEPNLFNDFLGSLKNLDERGRINPASLAAIRDTVEFLFHDKLLKFFPLDMCFYGIWTLLLIIFTVFVGRKSLYTKNHYGFILLCFFLYALLLPRFKDYSYILLIVPSIYVINKAVSSNIVKLLLIAAVCVHLFVYQPLLLAIILFGIFLRYVYKSESFSAAQAF